MLPFLPFGLTTLGTASGPAAQSEGMARTCGLAQQSVLSPSSSQLPKQQHSVSQAGENKVNMALS